MNQLLIIIGNSSFFASRAFLPALMIILCYRFHEYIPFYDPGVDIPKDAGWFFSNASLYSFLALSILEFFAMKNQDIREFLEEIMKKVRVVVAVAINFSLLSPETAAIMEQAQLAGFSIYQFFAILSGAIVHTVGTIRQEIFELIQDFDDDDDLRLQFGITIVEDLTIIVGILLLIAIPVLIISLTAFVLLLITLQKRHYQKVEDATRIECQSCQKKILPAATQCFSCGAEHESPNELGMLGQMTGKQTSKRHLHEVHLLLARRCPYCAEKLPKNAMKESCNTCKNPITKPMFQDLVEAKNRELLFAYIGLTAVGFIPVVGMVLTILYIRFNFIKPFKQFLPSNNSWKNRIIISILTFLMMFIQAIPLAGAAVPPLLLFINHKVWERSFKKGIEKSFQEEKK